MIEAISIAGISNDHTEAATITPDAKPSNDFCRRADISPRMKNTKAEPSIVPSSGINNPIINVIFIVCKGKTIYRIVQYSNIVNEKEEENRTVELCSKVGCTSEYQIKAFLFCSSLGFHYR